MKRTIVLLLLLVLTQAFAKVPSVGDAAFLFSLEDETGTIHNLVDFKGDKYVVLIFYPGDETPVCTQQLCEIRDEHAAFTSNNAVVFGVNPASGKSHKKFTDKHNFQFPLLIDQDAAVAKEYGVKGAVMNKRFVFVISPDGTIVFAKKGKPPVSEILQSINNPTGAFKEIQR
ncbi:MAG: peroxiredoxin [Fibrobacter sp.]|nr:peroxiredoxin [Fibrobacter sp.]